MAWGGLSIGCSNSLQRLQNRAAHIKQGKAMTEEAFKMLGWVNFEFFLIAFFLIILI